MLSNISANQTLSNFKTNLAAGLSAGRSPSWNAASKADLGLSNREKEIFNQISDKVSAQLGVPVIINKGTQSDCGQFNLALTGVVGVTANGPRAPFLITTNMLTQMAECEEKYNFLMAKIQEQIQTAIMRENQARANFAKAEQMDAEEDAQRREQQIRNSLMQMTDFWNVDRRELQSQMRTAQGQAIQQRIANQYEQMLSPSNN